MCPCSTRPGPARYPEDPTPSASGGYLVDGEVPVDDRPEDEGERVVVELEEAEYIEVAQEARRDVVAAPARRPHGTDHDGVDDVLPGHVPQVVPVAETSARRE